MTSPYIERPSDSPLVQSFAWGRAESEGVSVLYPDNTWFLLLTREQGHTRLAVGGPVSQSWYLPYTAGTEWLGIRFTMGTFLPHLLPGEFVNTAICLPEAARHAFWLNSSTWELPNLENAETFVNRLAREEMLVCDPLISSVLLHQPQELSAGTLRRRFARATGLTPGTARQIERARLAARLLKQGVSILDTVQAAGYFDQPHLTRSLRHFMRQTPAQIARGGQYAAA
jgi:AraC-like DNA-binding protein